MSGMDKFFEGLEKRASLAEAMESADTAVKGEGWYYVPKKTFLGGTLKPIVHEVAADKWEIMFCAPETGASKKTEKGAEDLMASKHIEYLQSLVLNEEVEGDKSGLNKWYVKAKWGGSFEECLKKCVSLVEGKADAVPTQFKQK
jgi:hypothetical protein